MEFPKGKVAVVLALVFMPALLATIFYSGVYYGQVNPDSQAVLNHRIYIIDRTTGEVRDEPVESSIGRFVYKPIEKVIERVDYGLSEGVVINRFENPGTLRYFQDLGELERWLEEVELPDIASEVASEKTSPEVKNRDCDDYSLKLQEDALRDGYMLSFEVINSGEYNDLFKEGRIPDGAIHAINSVIIGNKVYYIEPKTREIVFVANLD